MILKFSLSSQECIYHRAKFERWQWNSSLQFKMVGNSSLQLCGLSSLMEEEANNSSLQFKMVSPPLGEPIITCASSHLWDISPVLSYVASLMTSLSHFKTVLKQSVKKRKTFLFQFLSLETCQLFPLYIWQSQQSILICKWSCSHKSQPNTGHAWSDIEVLFFWWPCDLRSRSQQLTGQCDWVNEWRFIHSA